MKIIDAHYTQTLVVKQSKFMAHLTPFYMYDSLLAQLQREHPKARHFVTAFRYLNEMDQIVEGSSDDGEPRGTSGKPTLNVLQGHELVNVGIITVRYFGGTKLGTGGLVRAYGDAANLVIDTASMQEYQKEVRAQFQCHYATLQLVEYTLQQCHITRIEKQFSSEHVTVTVISDETALSQFFSILERQIIRL